VLARELGDLDAVRAKKPKRLPVLLSREEVLRLLESMKGEPKLVGTLLYGSGLRLGDSSLIDRRKGGVVFDLWSKLC